VLFWGEVLLVMFRQLGFDMLRLAELNSVGVS